MRSARERYDGAVCAEGEHCVACAAPSGVEESVNAGEGTCECVADGRADMQRKGSCGLRWSDYGKKGRVKNWEEVSRWDGQGGKEHGLESDVN